LPTPLEPQPTWKVTASHNPDAAAGAFTFASWTTGAPQQPGMWFQVELPEPTIITELQFTSPGGGGFGGGRGRGGRGGAAAATPAAPGGVPETPVPVTQPAPPGAFGMHPRGIKLEVSIDGRTWTTVSDAPGAPGSTTLSFAPIQAKFLKITQTATLENAPAWSMQRVRIFSQGASGGAR
jgi:hypothetical protein